MANNKTLVLTEKLAGMLDNVIRQGMKQFTFPPDSPTKKMFEEWIRFLQSDETRWTELVPFSKVRIGQCFTWVPVEWFGTCRLTQKDKREEMDFVYNDGRMKSVRTVKYDIKFDAAVVNPPGVMYGVPATTLVRLLPSSRKK